MALGAVVWIGLLGAMVSPLPHPTHLACYQVYYIQSLAPALMLVTDQPPCPKLHRNRCHIQWPPCRRYRAHLRMDTQRVCQRQKACLISAALLPILYSWKPISFLSFWSSYLYQSMYLCIYYWLSVSMLHTLSEDFQSLRERPKKKKVKSENSWKENKAETFSGLVAPSLWGAALLGTPKASNVIKVFFHQADTCFGLARPCRRHCLVTLLLPLVTLVSTNSCCLLFVWKAANLSAWENCQMCIGLYLLPKVELTNYFPESVLPFKSTIQCF